MGAVCGVPAIPKKVLIIGPKGAGKTSLLYAWCLQTDVETTPTESFNVETLYGVQNRQLLLAWDVSPSTRRRQFFHGTEGVVYVVDRDNASLQDVRADLQTTLQDRDLLHLPLMLVVSKSDLQGPTKEEIEGYLGVAALTQERPYRCVVTSIKDMVAFKDALETLCSLMFS